MGRRRAGAFWLGFTLVQGPDQARGSGWLERCRSIVVDHDLGAHGVAIGLETVRARALVDTGDFEGALVAAAGCAARARSAGDLDVWTLAQLVVGFCLVSLRRSDEALRVFDEVMLVVDRTTTCRPPVTGMAYCAVIAACLDLWDLRRAREWTAALTSWCDDASGAVPYRGYCLVHRAQIMAMGGSWADALIEAKSACELLREPALGLAWYALGELHRLRGLRTPTPRTPTAPPTRSASSRSPGWPRCGSRRAASTTPRPPCAGCSPSRSAATGPRCWRRTSR